MRLLQRTTRRLRLTAAGERYLHYCRKWPRRRAADDAMRQLQSEPAGPVVVSCPVSIAQDILAPLLPEFLDAWPAISVQLLVSNRRVDLISEGVDLALRVRTKLDTDAELVVRHLGTARGTLVASRATCNVTARRTRPGPGRPHHAELQRPAARGALAAAQR